MRIADLVMLFPFIALLSDPAQRDPPRLSRLSPVMGILLGFRVITIALEAQAPTVKVKPRIASAKVAGGSTFHIIRRRIVPDIMPLSFLYMTFSATGAVFTEAVLSYFGHPHELGHRVRTAGSAGYLGAFSGCRWPWAPLGAAIALPCFALYLVGRGLDAVVNPGLRKR